MGATPVRWKRTATTAVTLALSALPLRATAAGNGFALPKEDDAFNTNLEDFARYCGKKQWDAAFRSVSKIFDRPLKGFAADDDGVLLPSRQRVRQALLKLPADGLSAYRLFFDAQSRKLLDQATAAGADDRAPLQRIVDQFFLTTGGATAADRLGDADFEAGDFAAAAERWRLVLEQYPDPPMPAVRLMAKRATALARLGRTDAVTELATAVAEKYPGAQVSVGGRPRSAADYLASLAAVPTTGPSAAGATAAAAPTGATFAGTPDTTAEAWQTVFLPDSLAEEFHNAMSQTGWGRFMDPPDRTVPPSCTDGQRVYVCWLGVAFAIDATTGKLLWRTDKFTRLNGQGMMYIETGGDSGTAIAAAAGHVFAVGVAAPGGGNNRNFGRQAANSLACLEPKTGKVVWSTAKGALADYGFLGNPVVDGGTLYAVATKEQGGIEQLLALDPDKGTQQYAVPLGTAVGSTSFFNNNTKLPPPLLSMQDGTLYVLTNDGALLAFDPAGRSVKWALRTEGPEIVDRENMIIFSDDVAPPKVEPPGQIVATGGLIFVKETATHTLYAVDPAGPKLLWKRPLEKEQGIAADRDGRLITVGAAVEAVDPVSHALLWSTSVPAKTGQMRPVFDATDRTADGRGRMLVQSARGLYEIDTATGDTLAVRRGTDRDAVGADLLAVGDKLVCVSNRAVTAYPLKGATTMPATGPAGQ